MGIREVEKLKAIETACGNRYLAIKLLSKAVRKLGAQNEMYHISESKLLQWILTGECPYTTAELDLRRMIAENVDNINEYLDYVDDEEVCDKVRELYKQSIHDKHLTYCTDKNISPGRRSRINILLRMVWYQS